MTWPFVRTYIHREEVGSTSDLARALVNEGAYELPLLVHSDRQTQGRGRGTNVWWSDSGSLTFTLALDPAAHGLTQSHEPRLALAAAVALIDTISFPERYNAGSAGIRWPNDVEIGGRKLAGILPERLVTAHGPRLLIGIGVNVCTNLTDAPMEVGRSAVSLAELNRGTHKPPVADRLLADLLVQFESILPRLVREDSALADRWAMLDTLVDRPVRVDLGSELVTGLGGGIDAEGALCVGTQQGIRRLFGGRVLRDL